MSGIEAGQAALSLSCRFFVKIGVESVRHPRFARRVWLMFAWDPTVVVCAAAPGADALCGHCACLYESVDQGPTLFCL